MLRPKREWDISFIHVLISIFILSWLIFFHTRGFLPYDEGWILQAALRFYRGNLIYKDFKFVYNPGVIYLTALSFYLFGIGILASRIIALINSTISVLLIFLIGKRLNFSKLNYLFSVLIYLFWGPPVINFVWPVMFCITTGLAASYFFISEVEDKRHDFYIVLTGVFSALTFIFKQNFGLAIFLANAVFISLIKKYRNFRSIILHSAGFLSVLFVQGLYFLKTNTLDWYVREFYYYTYLKIFREGIYNSAYPWQYPGPLFFKILKTVLYLCPLIIAIYAFFKTYTSKKKHLIYIPLLLAFYYLLSIRPTTDYVHLAPLIAISGISLSIAYSNFANTPPDRAGMPHTIRYGTGPAPYGAGKQSSERTYPKGYPTCSEAEGGVVHHIANKFKVKSILFGLGLLLVALGLHSAIMKGYYKWHPPLITQSYRSNHPRVRIWMDLQDRQSIQGISNYFKKEAVNEKEIFIYEFAPVFYVILDKQNPTRYDFLHSGVLTPSIEKEVTEVLENKKIKYILADIEIGENPNTISTFVRHNYQADMRINKYTIWKLRD